MPYKNYEVSSSSDSKDSVQTNNKKRKHPRKVTFVPPEDDALSSSSTTTENVKEVKDKGVKNISHQVTELVLQRIDRLSREYKQIDKDGGIMIEKMAKGKLRQTQIMMEMEKLAIGTNTLKKDVPRNDVPRVFPALVGMTYLNTIGIRSTRDTILYAGGEGYIGFEGLKDGQVFIVTCDETSLHLVVKDKNKEYARFSKKYMDRKMSDNEPVMMNIKWRDECDSKDNIICLNMNITRLSDIFDILPNGPGQARIVMKECGAVLGEHKLTKFMDEQPIINLDVGRKDQNYRLTPPNKTIVHAPILLLVLSSFLQYSS